jgi:hypothetical protein
MNARQSHSEDKQPEERLSDHSAGSERFRTEQSEAHESSGDYEGGQGADPKPVWRIWTKAIEH